MDNQDRVQEQLQLDQLDARITIDYQPIEEKKAMELSGDFADRLEALWNANE